MTTRELRRDVSALCYTDISEKNERFIVYLNLALRTVFNDLKPIGRKTLYPKSVFPSSYTARILHKGKETVSVPLCGRAYSLIAVGKGILTVNDGKTSKKMELDTEGTAIRGFLDSEAELILSGDYAFSIYSLAVFEDILSERELDIPIFQGSRTFKLREVVKDFGGFVSPPKDSKGHIIKDAVFADGVLTLPEKNYEAIELLYRRLPEKIQIDYPDKTIDMPEEYSPLLVCLCAYYMCLEDEKEIAEEHYSHYKALLSSILANSTEGRGIDYVDTNGWA